MILLVLDPANQTLTDKLLSAVEAAKLAPDVVVDLGSDPEAISRYRLSRVPCLAKFYDGGCVDYLDDDWVIGKSAASIKGRFTNAVKAHDAAKAAMLP